MTRRFCDRCDVVLDDGQKHRLNVPGRQVSGYDIATDTAWTHELCGPCFDGFQRWINEPKTTMKAPPPLPSDPMMAFAKDWLA